MLLGVGGLWLNLTEIVCMDEQYETSLVPVGDKADRPETKYLYYGYEKLWLVLE